MDTSTKSSEADYAGRLLHAIDRWKWLGAFVLIAILTAAYWFLPLVLESKEWVEFCRSVIANMIPVFLFFVFSWSLFRSVDAVHKDRETQHFIDAVTDKLQASLLPLFNRKPLAYSRFNNVPWSEMIQACNSIDIIVQYFDSWAKTHQEALRDLFMRGGRVRILLPDPENTPALEQIRSRFLEYEHPALKGKIQNTPVRFAAIRDSAETAGRLEVRFVSLPIWYCALRFSNGAVALSPFESKRTIGVNSPCLIIDGDEAQDVVSWFDKEFDYLWSKGRMLDNNIEQPA